MNKPQDPAPEVRSGTLFGGLPRPTAQDQHLRVPSNGTFIRQATVADAEDIGEAHASAWEVAYVGLFDPDVLRDAAALRRTMWSQILASDFDFATLLVAGERGRVVGYSHFGQNREEAARGEVFGFYLHPSAWGHGAAMQLMSATLGELAHLGLDPVVVWTHPGAERAHAFYRKNGFTATGRSRIETLGSGIDAPEVEFVRTGTPD